MNFNKIIDRRNTDSKRWDLTFDDYQDTNIISMNIADMDFPAPKEVITAIKKRLKHPCFGYTRPMESLLNTICHFMEKKYQWKIHRDWIVLFSDATTALYYLLSGIKKDNSNSIIIQPPVFGSFSSDIVHAGYTVTQNCLILEKKEYFMNFDDLEYILKTHANIRALLLCNPHNPIGRVWTKDELVQLSNLCLQYNCLIISDELHSDLMLFDYQHIPIASLDQKIEQNTITSISPGKGFNIAGLKISALIIPNIKLRNDIIKASHGNTPNILAMEAYKAALEAGLKYYSAELSNYLSQNVIFLERFLHDHLPVLELIKPQATFLAWINLQHLRMSREELHNFMIKKAKLAISYGYHFGDGGEKFGRFNIGLPKAILKQALYRLKEGVDSLEEL